jgi:cyclopropane fatty-acyl-phospholipid synthase-like methyltransferase
MDKPPSSYYDRARVAARVEGGNHRRAIGGNWDIIGPLQLRFLISKGLKPESALLDIGCGSLRLGVRAVAYLDPGNYWGTDLNESLLEAGYEKEIVPAGLRDKLRRSNLVVDENFDFPGMPADFPFAIAQSVFTHLPLSYLVRCLFNLERHLRPGGMFFFTAFVVSEKAQPFSFVHNGANVTTHPDKDPYHFTAMAILNSAKGLPWKAEYIGEWGHPRAQTMFAFTRLKM